MGGGKGDHGVQGKVGGMLKMVHFCVASRFQSVSSLLSIVCFVAIALTGLNWHGLLYVSVWDWTIGWMVAWLPPAK